MKKNLLDYFFTTVGEVPNKTAVIEGDKRISFGELEQKARVLATTLIAKNSQSNNPVAVYIPKTINSVISDMAITYSANIYMNLDVKTPVERIRNILELIKPTILITDSAHLGTITNLQADFHIINIDEVDFSATCDEAPLLKRLDSQIDTDPYCIINTSGSTGTPKGVVLNHKSFIDFTEVSNEIFRFGNNEIIGSLSPLVFDIYSYELCMLMAYGSTIVLLPDNLAAFPIKILHILAQEKVSYLFWVPTIMVNIANMNLFANIALPDLRTVWFAGEVFPTKQFNYWKRSLPHTLFANLYGPIEITLDCTYFIVNREIPDDEPLPIGIPYRNTDILILNEENQPIKQGEEGELCVRGTSLAMGYYNNPEKTAAAFVQNPLNTSYPEIIYRTGDVVSYNTHGEIIFKGRKDSLIKHLGYRIELGEIEHALVNTLNLVENACVVYHTEKKEITLFYEADPDISATEFRKQMATILPKYMIPSVYIRLDKLPRNTNGKIDRLYLKQKVNQPDAVS